jgi:hypothetical protein
VTYIGIALCACTVFLLLAGEAIARRRIRRQRTDRLAFIDERIRTRPDERACWRTVKQCMEEDDL